MKPIVAAWFAVLLISSAAAADFPLVGTWKLDTAYREVVASGQRSDSFGPHPDGVIIFTPEGRLTALVVPAPESRSGSDAAELPRPFLAFSGPYTPQGEGKFVYQLDVTLNPSPKGTDRERTYKISGNKLTLILPTTKQPDGQDVRTVFEWTRAK